jgi:hypothetical protein
MTRSGPWTVTLTCSTCGEIGRGSEISDEDKPQLEEDWRRRAEAHGCLLDRRDDHPIRAGKPRIVWSRAMKET